MQDDVYVADDGSRCCVLTIMEDDVADVSPRCCVLQDDVMSMLLMMVQDVVC